MKLDITAETLSSIYCTEDMVRANKNRYSTSYICTVPATAKAEGVEKAIRDGIKYANRNRKANGLRPLRVVARGRGANRLDRVRASVNTSTPWAERGAKRRVAQDLPRSVAESLDLYIYEV